MGDGRGRPVALLFPGQGSQRAKMAAGLFEHDPVFTAEMVRTCRAMGDVGERLLKDWLADSPDVSIDATLRSQPLLFAVGFALGRMLLSWGVRPVAVLGHSVGELVAGTLAGIFEPASAARVCWRRLAPLVQAPAGGMLAVAAAPEEFDPFLASGVEIGALNAPRQVILSGPLGALRTTADRLTARGYTCQWVPSSSAFHSSSLEAAARSTTKLFAALNLRPPAIAMYSACTGGLLDDNTAVDPEFWSMQPAAPVFFWQALDAMLRHDDLMLVEAGPGQMLSRIARRHPKVRSGRGTVIPVLPVRSGTPGQDRAFADRARVILCSA